MLGIIQRINENSLQHFKNKSTVRESFLFLKMFLGLLESTSNKIQEKKPSLYMYNNNIKQQFER